MPKLRAWSSLDELVSVELEVSHHVAEHIGDPPKYDPRNRETADHSLPYLLAVALVDGEISLDSYRSERFLDPALRPVMQKFVIRPTQEFTDLRANGLYGVTRPTPARLRARRRDGAELVEEVRYFKGHMRDPMTRADIDDKLDRVCAGVLSDEQRERIRAAWWGVLEADDISPLIGTLRREPGSRQ
jgi:2-methylcitrate dehydratase